MLRMLLLLFAHFDLLGLVLCLSMWRIALSSGGLFLASCLRIAFKMVLRVICEENNIFGYSRAS